jgi:four helix bundle protein
MTNEEFSEVFKARTKTWAVKSVHFAMGIPETAASRVVRYQLIKSATSTTANYRARSPAEFHAKLSITIEEADETMFWFEFVEEAGMDKSPALYELKQESLEIVSILSKARKNTQK